MSHHHFASLNTSPITINFIRITNFSNTIVSFHSQHANKWGEVEKDAKKEVV